MSMKNKITAMILTLALAVSVILTTCCANASPSEEIDESRMDNPFVIIQGEGYGDYYLVYHKDTKVMYIVSNVYKASRGSFELLVNSDGTPMLWEGD